MEDELNKLLNKRRSVIKRVELLLDLAQRAQSDEKFVDDFQMRYETLNEMVNLFESLHLEAVSLVSCEKLEEQDEVQTQFDNVQYSIKSIHREIFGKPIPSDSVHSPHSVRSGAASVEGHNPRDTVKLPRIEIPKFDGDIKNWPTFFDMFDTLIHKNSMLSDVERFQYLISCLSKTALSVTKNLPLTAENYHIALDSLKKRYQNKRLLLTTYWQALDQAPKVTNNSDSALRNLLSVFSENMAALDQFQHDMWDFTKLNWLAQKIDNNTRTRFEIEVGHLDIPKYADLFSFCEKQCRALETSHLTCDKSSLNNTSNKKIISRLGEKRAMGSHASTMSLVTNVNNTACTYCKKEHSMLKCDGFLTLSPQERYNFVKKERLCFNCLSNGHNNSKCASKHNCRVCHKRHHTYLHFPESASSGASEGGAKTESESVTEDGQIKVLSTTFDQGTVLLATALVEVQDACGRFHQCRVLLDSASQASFVTEECAKRLGIPRSSSSVPIKGLNQMTSIANSGTIQCTLKPIQNATPILKVNLFVIPNVCGQVPTIHISELTAKHLKDLSLADPTFGKPSAIDMLLGADVYSDILLPGIKRGNTCVPSAINTVFGWVLLGKVQGASNNSVHVLCTSIETSLEYTLKRFWEIEHIPQDIPLSSDDQLCEKIFKETHSRDVTGRFVVELPFKNDSIHLGESYANALRRFVTLEDRLLKNPELYQAYLEFMQDMLDQNHMSHLSNQAKTTIGYHIPQHCVVKSDKAPFKIRTVFDASAKTSTGTSLNDLLLVGPKLQKDIGAILLVFRLHSIAFTADIRQMYRQILVSNHHRQYQKILWRSSRSQPISEFVLNTVTFGVSSSPYLALRCLVQLAQDAAERYPLASEVIQSSIYVDDIVCGANSPEAAIELQSQLIELLAEGGFELRKWASNDPSLLSLIPEGHQQPMTFDSESTPTIKILGLQWCPNTDVFSYTVDSVDHTCTKRTVLSDVARIYDPLGLLTPLTIFAKCIIQSFWLQGLDWDQEPPPEITSSWREFKAQLSCLTLLSIPRRVSIDNPTCTELHGFCDASEKAYAAVVYLRQVSTSGVTVSLLCGKSKVAPLKRLSIPRLELCAANLLADLIEFVVQTFHNHLAFDNIVAWSDSTIVLSWIRSSPHQWKSFVANRATHIQSKIPPNSWCHVRGIDNPADSASRGLMPNELCNHPLWWTGPPWLKQPRESWPHETASIASEINFERRNLVFLSAIPAQEILDLLHKFSSLQKIIRIVAYCQRFVDHCRKSRQHKTNGFDENDRYQALLVIVRLVQQEVFSKELENIKSNEPCSKSIRKLAPFLDKDGVLRVGGRIRHSDLSFDAKHPILLPRSHRLTDLVVEDVHRSYLHPGLTTLQYLITQRFWILSPRRAINHTLSRCYRCFKARPTPLAPYMSDLPIPRTSQSKPFSHTGVDFAGPFLVTPIRRRGAKAVKAYICVFVCLSTKAIHLETVSNLSAEAFLAALRRFVARRGRCVSLYSDCGTNFVGANRMLLSYCRDSADELHIAWRFNPPSSPHFGGLWEAGVKSVKSHLKRVVGIQCLSYEEFSTVLCQIEAVLNSRPLCASSPDPNDLRSLTPGHFLTQEALNAPPDEDTTGEDIPRLSRWQLVQRMYQDFWRRWHLEYLHTLQQRAKWNTPQCPPSVGQFVLIKDETAPPLQWRLGRLIKLYPGKDNISRVALVETSKGTLNRPLVKLCPLPNQ